MLVLLLVLTSCSIKQTSSNSNQSGQPAAANQPSQPAQPAAAPQPSQPAGAVKPISELKEGEASGTIVLAGETITLKYAYAGHGERFGEEAVVFLLTEAPIAPQALSKAFEKSNSFTIFPEDTRGLEYNVGKGFWVMYHPGRFQASGSNTLKDYLVENGVVRGRDEDSTEFFGKEYKRSVSFVARLREKQ
jgi:hypothetical protein